MQTPEGVIWIDWWEVYISWDWSHLAGQCKAVHDYDGWMSILNIYDESEWIRTTCGHILDGWICGYLTHVTNETTICPNAVKIGISPQNNSQKKQAA